MRSHPQSRPIASRAVICNTSRSFKELRLVRCYCSNAVNHEPHLQQPEMKLEFIRGYLLFVTQGRLVYRKHVNFTFKEQGTYVIGPSPTQYCFQVEFCSYYSVRAIRISFLLWLVVFIEIYMIHQVKRRVLNLSTITGQHVARYMK